jgi:two-component system, response regulator PdtaR
VFAADPKTLQRVARHLDRVLVADPHTAAGKLISDLVKDVGGRHVMYAREQVRAAEIAREFDPQLIFVELSGQDFDGCAFVKALRRSDYVCRKAPVIMVTAEATVETIKAARDSGVHEFLRKPFTTRDLFKRVENVTLKPRLWIEAKMYVGPDRRRFNSEEYGGARKRRSDGGGTAAAAPALNRFGPMLRAIRGALELYAARPQASLRAMLEQAAELQTAAFHFADADLSIVVASLQRYLLQALEAGDLSRLTVEDHCAAVLALSGDDALTAEARRELARELSDRAATEQLRAA